MVSGLWGWVDDAALMEIWKPGEDEGNNKVKLFWNMLTLTGSWDIQTEALGRHKPGPGVQELKKG